IFFVLLLCVVIGMFLGGCISFKRVLKPEIPLLKVLMEGELSVAENRWQLLDFSDLGFWVFGIKENCLKTLITPSPFYGLRIQGVTYPLIENPLAPGILQLFLSEQLARDLIRGGTVVSLNNPSGSRSFRQEELLTIEQVILDRGVEENGTTLYGISLTDYFHLRQPLNVFISPQNACIFPSYILSNEENAYPMDAFLAARQQPGVDSVHQALLCLKSGTEAENKLRLSFVNPNPVTLIAGLPHIGVPDRRDRIRQLGIEGVRDEEVYVLIDDPDQSRTRVQIFRSRLPEGYNDSFFWKATLCDTGFLFFETDEPDTLQISIPYGLTTSWERIRNSRFEKLVPSGLQVTTTSPESGSLVNSLEVLLEWEGSPGLFSEGKSPRAVPEITEYRVYFAPMITENYPEPTTVATTSLLKTGLNYNTEYKWKILAVQNDGQTAISQEATFRTLQDPTPDPNLVAVNAAIALARGANPIALLPVPGGNAATQTQKEAAVKAYLQALPGMGGLGVNISVVWNPLTGEYLVTISKGGVSQSMTIAVTAYADSTPDQTAVDTAIGLVNGDDPIAS
ncbi:MAG TPA: fibronectin type III domain-containing protein, partial [Thermotogota bacterium]|nr:fibronectin type III domain-containing protein [Thermotogota bacterium]